MSTPAEIVISILTADTDVTALVGQRIAVGWRDRGDDIPCIVIDEQGNDADDAAAISGTASMLICDLSVDCAAATHSASDEIAEEVLSALAGTAGATSAGKAYSISAHRGPAEHDAEPDGSAVIIYPINTTLYLET